MLAERVDAVNRDDGLAELGTPANRPTTVFNNAFTPVANITKINIDVNVAVNADIVAMFNYTSCGWSYDLGYNFWAVVVKKSNAITVAQISKKIRGHLKAIHMCSDLMELTMTFLMHFLLP